MSKEHELCPCCGKSASAEQDRDGWWHAMCGECTLRTQKMPSASDAWSMWDRRVEDTKIDDKKAQDTKTLRDEFAISLAASICAEHIRTPVEPEWREGIAIEAYRIADLLLLERKERHGCLKSESQDTLPPDPKTAEAKLTRLEKWLDDTDRSANLESLEMTERLDRSCQVAASRPTKRDAILSFTLAVRRVLKGQP